MNGRIEKNTRPPSWLPSNVPMEHLSGFVYAKERPCASHQTLGLGCNGKPKVEAALWQHRQSNGAIYQVYRCLECGSTIGSSVKQLPHVRARTDNEYIQIEQQYKAKLAAAQPDDLNREAFLRSPEWLTIRARILAFDGNRCRVCGENADAVHHRSNENYRNPKDEELVSLCHRCHEAIHSLNPFERERKSACPDWPGHEYCSRTPPR